MDGGLKNVNREMVSDKISKTDGNRNHSVHAEVAVYITARKARIPIQKIRQATLYVARATGQNPTYGDSKPCELCMKFLNRIGLTRVYYTIPGGINRL